MADVRYAIYFNLKTDEKGETQSLCKTYDGCVDVDLSDDRNYVNNSLVLVDNRNRHDQVIIPMDKVLFLEKFSVEPQQPEMPGFSPDEMMAAAMAGAPMMTPPMEASENVEEAEEVTNSEMLVQTVEDNNEEE